MGSEIINFLLSATTSSHRNVFPPRSSLTSKSSIVSNDLIFQHLTCFDISCVSFDELNVIIVSVWLVNDWLFLWIHLFQFDILSFIITQLKKSSLRWITDNCVSLFLSFLAFSRSTVGGIYISKQKRLFMKMIHEQQKITSFIRNQNCSHSSALSKLTCSELSKRDWNLQVQIKIIVIYFDDCVSNSDRFECWK